MEPLFTEEEFKNSKELDQLPLKCEVCGERFLKTKVTIRNARNPNRRESCCCCSSKCKGIHKIKSPPVDVSCLCCGKKIKRLPSQLKAYPKSFCSKSCGSKYSNAHKTSGTTRSKLEFWVESKLAILYPSIEILYNKTSAIGAELDIYIPSLKLGFEINGIFHFEPIFGCDKLVKTQNNDKKKIESCIENNIYLCVIDTSELKYFKQERAIKYLNVIKNMIDLFSK